MQDETQQVKDTCKSPRKLLEARQDMQKYKNVSLKPQSAPGLVKSTFINMITDDEMSDFFISDVYVQGLEDIQLQQSQQSEFRNENQEKVKETRLLQSLEKQHQQQKTIQSSKQNEVNTSNLKQTKNVNIQQKNVITRLQVEIQKNSLLFQTLHGEAFILMSNAKLVGQKRQQKGKLMMTNYRMAFFKERQKRVDVPFGFIQNIKFHEKSNQLVLHLKYRHFWKFQISHPNVFKQFMTYSQLYICSDSVKSSFAFSYALKSPQAMDLPLHQQKTNKMLSKYGYSHQRQYLRVQIINNSDYQLIDNQDTNFSLCKSYPPTIYVSSAHNFNLTKQVGIYRNNRRFPVLTYLYKNIQKEVMPIWRSSSYVQDQKSISSKSQALMLQHLGANLHVFIAENRQNNSIKDQADYGKKSKIVCTYLNLQSVKQMKQGYLQLVGCFLSPKKQFIKEIINTKWYQMVSNLLYSASLIANKVLRGHSILIRCNNGYDRSAQLSALVLLILDPYYRTFQGFPVLIEKQFVQFGHPFASRLGSRQGPIDQGLNQSSTENVQQFPIFIQFLDCVSQLINLNKMSFQFNQKYLSKLSNIIYTNIFGNFICNSYQEIIQNNVRNETISVWNLLSPSKSQRQNGQSFDLRQLTTNAFYQQRSGILQNTNHANALSEMRLWRQHFWYLTTALKDTYKLYPFAQDNYDYLNIECLKIKNENKNLKNSINEQKKKLFDMKQQLKNLKGIQQQQQMSKRQKYSEG